MLPIEESMAAFDLPTKDEPWHLIEAYRVGSGSVQMQIRICITGTVITHEICYTSL